MSIEILRLQCVLERSVDRVAEAITSMLRREGWRLAEDEQHPEAREIRLASKKGWVVVDELDRVGMEVFWVANLSRELGCVGIGMGAEPDVDSFVIERWSAGQSKGRVSFEGSPGPRKKSAPLKVAFLADLVDDARRRGQFARGIDVSAETSTEMFNLIARDAGLPTPLSRQEELLRPRILRFLPPLRMRKERAVTVRFETSFHVRGVESDELTEALRVVLKSKRRVNSIGRRNTSTARSCNGCFET